MLQQKIARLASDFAARLIGVMTAAPLEELVELRRPSSRKPVAGRTVAVKTPTKKMATRARSGAAKRSTVENEGPGADVTTAALAFFAERGTKGATAHQLGMHLAERGLPSAADVVGALVTAGAIRDAGFRRAAGKNATASVYVAT